MKQCTHCLLTDAYPGLSFEADGQCSLCAHQKVFEPYGEDKLLQILDSYKKKAKGKYDALVPLSGGKDSTYILYLATQKYHLRVLAMTYDNGFVSQIAADNMQRALRKTNTEMITVKPDHQLLQKIYKTMLLSSGDICGACGIAIRASMCKVAADHKIPMILLGTSPLEEGSFLPDTTQDVQRFRHIMLEAGNTSRQELKEFLIYPKMNFFKLSLGKMFGIYAKEVCPLFYIPNPSDKEMGDIIKREMDWQEDTSSEYSKHFDCVVEPFTNYVRQHIYGYERRICQYSTMIRRGEISREKALEMYTADHIAEKPANYDEVLDLLGLDEKDMDKVLQCKPLAYEKYVSKANKLYSKLRKKK